MQYALLIIDMQNGIFELKQPVWDAESLIGNVNQAIRYARGAGIRVIFSQHENRSFLKPGTEAHRIAGSIELNKDDAIISKKHPDVFKETGLDDMLKTEGIQGLIVAGLISNGCVRDACLSAKQKGYEALLLSDAHSTFYSNAKKVVETVNREMEQAGVRLGTVEQMGVLCPQ